MQRRARLSPDGRAASITRSEPILSLRSSRALIPAALPSGGVPAALSRRLSLLRHNSRPSEPGGELGSGLPPSLGLSPCPGPGQVPALPPKGGGDMDRRTGTDGTPGRRRVPALGWSVLPRA